MAYLFTISRLNTFSHALYLHLIPCICKSMCACHHCKVRHPLQVSWRSRDISTNILQSANSSNCILQWKLLSRRRKQVPFYEATFMPRVLMLLLEYQTGTVWNEVFEIFLSFCRGNGSIMSDLLSERWEQRLWYAQLRRHAFCMWLRRFGKTRSLWDYKAS